ncbi:hypothetical protein STEG23_037305 [Scotinomys teguina]
MEMKAAAPRCQLLLILLMSAVMLLPGTNGSLLLVQRTVTRTIVLEETIGKGEGKHSDSFGMRNYLEIHQGQCNMTQDYKTVTIEWLFIATKCFSSLILPNPSIVSDSAYGNMGEVQMQLLAASSHALEHQLP